MKNAKAQIYSDGDHLERCMGQLIERKETLGMLYEWRNLETRNNETDLLVIVNSKSALSLQLNLMPIKVRVTLGRKHRSIIGYYLLHGEITFTHT